jgi:hypothetical protein
MTTARYVVLLHGDENVWDARDASQQQRTDEDHRQFGVACAERGHKIVGGEELQAASTAFLVRRGDGPLQVTEGPFAETAEQLGGFYLVEAPDVETVLKHAHLLPADYTIEVREIMQL